MPDGAAARIVNALSFVVLVVSNAVYLELLRTIAFV